MRCGNPPNTDLAVFRGKLRQQGYTESLSDLYGIPAQTKPDGREAAETQVYIKPCERTPIPDSAGRLSSSLFRPLALSEAYAVRRIRPPRCGIAAYRRAAKPSKSAPLPGDAFAMGAQERPRLGAVGLQCAAALFCGTFFVGAMSHAMRRNAVYLRCITERAPPSSGARRCAASRK